MKSVFIKMAAWLVAMNLTAEANSQVFPDHRTFVQEGKVWKMKRSSRQWSCDSFGRLKLTASEWSFFDYTMCGDTLIGGKPLKKVYRNDLLKYGDRVDHYFCAVREEDSRVYVIYAEEDKEQILYDFRPNGECEEVVFTDLWNKNCQGYPQNFDVTVIRESHSEDLTIDINGYPTLYLDTDYYGKIKNFPEKDASKELDIHESKVTVGGVGCVESDPFDVSVWADASSDYAYHVVRYSDSYMNGNYDDVEPYSFYMSPEIESIYLNGICIASHSELLGIEPPPTSLERLYNTKGQVLLYDLQGRRLSREPQHGLFIRDGRKYVK